MKVRLLPPAGQKWKRGADKVGPDGCDFLASEVDYFISRGWTRAKPEKKPEPKKRTEPKAAAEVKSDG